jgi:hypothetical protein
MTKRAHASSVTAEVAPTFDTAPPSSSPAPVACGVTLETGSYEIVSVSDDSRHLGARAPGCPASSQPPVAHELVLEASVPTPELVAELVALATGRVGTRASRAQRFADLAELGANAPSITVAIPPPYPPSPPMPAPAIVPGSYDGEPHDLVRLLVGLALDDDQASAAESLAQLAAMEARGLLPSILPPAPPAPNAPAKRRTPMQERRRRMAAINQTRAQYEARNTPQSKAPNLDECRAGERAERKAEAAARSLNKLQRPTRPIAIPIGWALERSTAALRVRDRRRAVHPAEERQAIAAVARRQYQAHIAPIRAALDDLRDALERSRLAPEQVELIERSLANAVRLFHAGELDREAVLAHVWMHQRSLAQKRRERGAAEKALQRIDDAERERAIVLANDSADPFDQDVFEQEQRRRTKNAGAK